MRERHAKWRVIKRNGRWIAYKRWVRADHMPYVVPLSNNSFDTWAAAMAWARNNSRKLPEMARHG